MPAMIRKHRGTASQNAGRRIMQKRTVQCQATDVILIVTATSWRCDQCNIGHDFKSEVSMEEHLREIHQINTDSHSPLHNGIDSFGSALGAGVSEDELIPEDKQEIKQLRLVDHDYERVIPKPSHDSSVKNKSSPQDKISKQNPKSSVIDSTKKSFVTDRKKCLDLADSLFQSRPTPVCLVKSSVGVEKRSRKRTAKAMENSPLKIVAVYQSNLFKKKSVRENENEGPRPGAVTLSSSQPTLSKGSTRMVNQDVIILQTKKSAKVKKRRLINSYTKKIQARSTRTKQIVSQVATLKSKYVTLLESEKNMEKESVVQTDLHKDLNSNAANIPPDPSSPTNNLPGTSAQAHQAHSHLTYSKLKPVILPPTKENEITKNDCPNVKHQKHNIQPLNSSSHSSATGTTDHLNITTASLLPFTFPLPDSSMAGNSGTTLHNQTNNINTCIPTSNSVIILSPNEMPLNVSEAINIATGDCENSVLASGGDTIIISEPVSSSFTISSLENAQLIETLSTDYFRGRVLFSETEAPTFSNTTSGMMNDQNSATNITLMATPSVTVSTHESVTLVPTLQITSSPQDNTMLMPKPQAADDGAKAIELAAGVLQELHENLLAFQQSLPSQIIGSDYDSNNIIMTPIHSSQNCDRLYTMVPQADNVVVVTSLKEQNQQIQGLEKYNVDNSAASEQIILENQDQIQEIIVRENQSLENLEQAVYSAHHFAMQALSTDAITSDHPYGQSLPIDNVTHSYSLLNSFSKSDHPIPNHSVELNGYDTSVVANEPENTNHPIPAILSMTEMNNLSTRNVEDITHSGKTIEGDSPSSQEKLLHRSSSFEENNDLSLSSKHPLHVCSLCEHNFHTVDLLVEHTEKYANHQPAQCRSCNLRLHNIHLLNLHIFYVHEKKGPASCLLCNKIIGTRRTLLCHLASVHLGLEGKNPEHLLYDSRGMHTCTICKRKIIETRASIDRHYKLHTTLKNYACQVCGKRFQFKYLLLSHLETHNPQNPDLQALGITEEKIIIQKCHLKAKYTCERCGKSMMNVPQTIRRHMYRHTVKDVLGDLREKYHCPDCGKEIAVIGQNVALHMQTHGRTIQCRFCEKIFSTIENRRRHEKRVHGATEPEKCMCEICGKLVFSKYTLLEHIKLHSEAKGLFSCDQCPKSFHYQSQLERHKAKHSSRITNCEYCGKPYMTKNSLERHVKVEHMGVKDYRYKCDQCTAQFFDSIQLRDHKAYHHEGVRRYKCQICGESFVCRPTLQRHIRRAHEGQTPYICKVCGQNFVEKSQLLTHEAIHTGIEPFQCSSCKKAFTRPRSLQLHMNLHMGIRPHLCEGCGKAYGKKNHLDRHRQRCKSLAQSVVQNALAVESIP